MGLLGIVFELVRFLGPLLVLWLVVWLALGLVRRLWVALRRRREERRASREPEPHGLVRDDTMDGPLSKGDRDVEP